MGKKHRKSELKKAVFSGLSKLSQEDLEAIIKKETEKGIDEADFEYIDLCMELLERKEKHTEKAKKVVLKPFIVAAAVISVLVVIAVSVSAKSIEFNIPEDKATLVKGNAVIEGTFESMNAHADGYKLKNTKLFKDFKENNITPITFPALMASDECEITSEVFQKGSAIVKFIFKEFAGEMYVNKYDEIYNTVDSQETIYDIKSAQMACINGLEVLVFEQKNNCVFKYTDGRIEYSFTVDCDLKTALEFIKSIK